jgi:hypothetical protein
MLSLVKAITMAGVVMIGLAVMVGKLKVEDALMRIAALILILTLVPSVAALATAALPMLVKPLLLLLALIVVVTVLVRALVSLF